MRKENESRKRPAKKRRNRRRTLIVLGTAAALVLGVILFAWTTRITEVTVTGSGRYTDEELISMIFTEDRDWNTIYAVYQDKFREHKDIPFIEKYHVSVTGLHSAKITVYEKSLAGCIEYMGTYMYFDKDGIIVESSGERTPSVPLVTGLRFESIVMYEKLTVEDEGIFGEILNLSQLLERYEIQVDKLSFDNSGNVDIYVGGIRVVLGSNQYMAEKISEFHDMYPQISSLSGILYLNEYAPDALNPSYPFIQN